MFEHILLAVDGSEHAVHAAKIAGDLARKCRAHAALVRQRAGLFGVMAVLGLVLAIIAPFMEAGLI